MNSPSASSSNAADKSRSLLPAVEPAAGEGAVAEEVRPTSSATPADGEEQGQASAEKQSRDFKGRRRQKERRLIAKQRKAYSVLLAETAQDTAVAARYGDNDFVPLSDSRVGASFWSREEKERLFSALARHEIDDLPRIAGGVATKSEAEVRLFLLALQAGFEEHADVWGSKYKVLRLDLPAAHEISEDCESALDLAADVLAGVEEREVARIQQKKYGDEWLLEDEAADFDSDSMEAELAGLQKSKKQPGKQPDEPDDERVVALAAPSAMQFFDTAMLLQLSRNVFMNGPPDGHWNYRTTSLLNAAASETDDSDKSDSISELPTEPAIYLSALTNLHDIVTTATQKLVHATLFQATSRLRAKDDHDPAPLVLASDVHVAAETLGLPLDAQEYWAKLPRRAGLDVYSESDKYKRFGRAGTKNGVRLTYDEVEAELGLVQDASKREKSNATVPDVLHEEDDDPASSASDDFDASDDSDVSSDGILEVQAERQERKRRRALSPDSLQRAEERYMQTLDKKADRAEDARLRDLLGLESGSAMAAEAAEREDTMPARPKLKRRAFGRTEGDWRDSVERMARWEVEAVRKRLLEQEDDSESGMEMDGEVEGEITDIASDEAGMAGGNRRSSSDEMQSQ